MAGEVAVDLWLTRAKDAALILTGIVGGVTFFWNRRRELKADRAKALKAQEEATKRALEAAMGKTTADLNTRLGRIESVLGLGEPAQEVNGHPPRKRWWAPWAALTRQLVT